ncbi:ARM repeat-containing protein [Lophiostoma macrostomum CBS 122681]|uniref:ARM repeat-containing protein n=1 Tax=Lophiostoma macrostomum CBS 122681 TaxID=1314788 RepID=A0A6A6TK79_9PLEO|nr:ARM repeat-containing protein [Lophiostoma macrostomum CBS 122681]
MGRSSMPPALVELANPTSPEAQVAALRNLKNEIVGHDQRKELAVRHGVVKPLTGILRTEARKGGKRRRWANGNSSAAREGERATEWGTEEELRFQATLVVGSLANGGPAFIAPLLAGDVLSPLVETLSPSEVPSKLLVATLRTLNQIADAVTQEGPWKDAADGPLRSTLSSTVYGIMYARPVVESLAEILAQETRSATAHQQISLAAKLIAKTCQEESQKKLLLDAGILDLLATKLAAIASVDAQALRMEPRQPSREELPAMYLPDIIEAIAAFVERSNYNAARFIYSQPIQQLFGASKEDGYAYQATPWEKLTPRLQTIQNKSDAYAKSWPALGSFSTLGTVEGYNRLDALQTTSRTVITDEPENALFIWLMFVARRNEGRTRLSACWLLALLKIFGDKWPLNDPSKTTRDRHFSYLIIPLVIKMIDEANETSDYARRNAPMTPQAREECRFLLARSPLVLAALVGNNKTLQNAAVDARVLLTLVQILKKSFDPVTTSSKPLWSPRPASNNRPDPTVDQPSSTLGSPGFSAEIIHGFRCRESALLALAAMADTQDHLRKLVIEIGAATYILDSLVPYSEQTKDLSPSTPHDASASSRMGNPVPVLVAACKVTRSLSRSVSVLRTSLIDHGIAQPSFDLLTHPNVRVQIAATEVITNLVLEVSPMRTEIMEAGALKTLCEHCRSANFDLRFSSLWALKHLCLGISTTTKIQCLEELGVGWLVQTLNGEPGKGSTSTPLGMGTPNAAGEQVDILNAVDDPHMDVDEEASSPDDEDTMTDSIASMRRHQHHGSRYTSATNIRDRLQQIKNDEQDQRLNSERDDIRMQEQALDFLRNFTAEEKASGEMIDHLLKSFGHSRFFELLDAKLRPKGASAIPGPSQPRATGIRAGDAPNYWSNLNTTREGGNWASYPPTELIASTLWILVHLANGRPQHRSLLISQSQLMQHVLPLLSHPRRDVRLPCAWFINNLTWVEDHGDEPASRERAQSLRQLGFEEGARLLGRDTDLDIRERAKTAVEQMGKLLGDGGRSTGYQSPAGFGEQGGAGGAGGGGGNTSSVSTSRNSNLDSDLDSDLLDYPCAASSRPSSSSLPT